MAPRYQIIKDHILEQVHSGSWAAGTKVPSENQLAEQFSVSRMTSRRALTELTEANVLERIQGTGTFVAEQLPTGSVMEIRNIADEIVERGNVHHAKVLAMQEIVLDQNSANTLGLEKGASAYFSRILHFENNSPIQIEQRLVNPKLVPDYLNQNFSEMTPNKYLSELIPLSEADHWIEAVPSTELLSQWLEIELHQPCLKISRRTYDPKQNVVNFAVFYHPGNKYRLGGHLNF